jgi:hypothetical protein
MGSASSSVAPNTPAAKLARPQPCFDVTPDGHLTIGAAKELVSAMVEASAVASNSRTLSHAELAALFSDADAFAAGVLALAAKKQKAAGPDEVSQAAIQLKIAQLGSVSTVLGQQETEVVDITGSLASARAAFLEATHTDHTSKAHSVGKLGYSAPPTAKALIQKYQIEPKEAELAVAEAARDITQATLSRMRSEYGEAVIPLAKEGTRR